jgi:hypothetical protein
MEVCSKLDDFLVVNSNDSCFRERERDKSTSNLITRGSCRPCHEDHFTRYCPSRMYIDLIREIY